MNLDIIDLGLMEYESAWKLQDQLADEIARGERNPALLLVEHPHTYTFGRRGQAQNLLWDESQLKERGVAVHWVDRGGDVTYHGPGQLVGYPLIPLPRPLSDKTEGGDRIPNADYVGYVRKLEQVLITALAQIKISAQTINGLTGVWITENRIKPAKIAAIGVKVDARGITRHGFALNVTTDLSFFDGIIACGIAYPAIRVCDRIDHAEMDSVKQAVINSFAETFGAQTSPRNI
jgi:lipoate-protein ligase B